MSARRQSSRVHEDGQLVIQHAPYHDDPYAQYRWDQRAPPAWEGHNVRAAWREATPLPARLSERADAYERVHGPADMVLVAHLGILRTCWRVDDYGDRRAAAMREVAES
jgi:hypothetical protein